MTFWSWESMSFFMETRMWFCYLKYLTILRSWTIKRCWVAFKLFGEWRMFLLLCLYYSCRLKALKALLYCLRKNCPGKNCWWRIVFSGNRGRNWFENQRLKFYYKGTNLPTFLTVFNHKPKSRQTKNYIKRRSIKKAWDV